jgi:CBS domain-containing protein
MRVKDVMTTPVVTIRADASPKEAAALLREREIGALPVVDEHDDLIGMISETDLIRLGTEGDPRRHLLPLPRRYPAKTAATVAELMTAPVLTVNEDTDVASAARLMLERDVRQLAVVSAGHVVGIIARRDLIKVLARDDEQIKAELEELFNGETLVDHYTIEVHEGVATLDGSADSADRRLARILARGVPGVIEVVFRDEV